VVLGVAGSVGTITAQLAVARGITVIGTADSADLDRVHGLGVTAVPYGPGWADRVRAVAPDGVDAVFDTAGAGLLADAVATEWLHT
jgi:NADPH:quinone reductase-like Zn-dependent oxidoreductase